MSTPSEHLFFDARPAWAVADGGSDVLHWFTVIGKPIGQADLLSGGKHREWHQAALLSPFLDEGCDPARTRVFADVFLHASIDATPDARTPLAMVGMRLAYDRSGCTFGPFRLANLHRRQPPRGRETLITLRYGFVELDDQTPDRLYVHTCASIHERRAVRSVD